MHPQVNVFNQFYNKLMGEHRSGWSDDQIKQHARELYYQSQKKTFPTRALAGNGERSSKMANRETNAKVIEQNKK